MEEKIIVLKLSFKYKYFDLTDKIIKYIATNGYKHAAFSSAFQSRPKLFTYYLDNIEYINNEFINDVFDKITDHPELITYMIKKLTNLKCINWFVIRNAEARGHFETAEILKKEKHRIDLHAYNHINVKS
jgi:hypothetical protein